MKALLHSTELSHDIWVQSLLLLYLCAANMYGNIISVAFKWRSQSLWRDARQYSMMMKTGRITTSTHSLVVWHLEVRCSSSFSNSSMLCSYSQEQVLEGALPKVEVHVHSQDTFCLPTFYQLNQMSYPALPLVHNLLSWFQCRTRSP